ncbi:hypothetical protein N7495_003921 [Penicillium taxi]|uniref:uncharacterized protein n=1 Tax=Penicillium taxi TaxID=168475 RepID=UPI0025456C7C|nr:uncharacterized protein N7495_003921 [Penicillium taxi]KAJ5899177.1 hypothetical protein N7495_003921 [Penicillium taxi]
MRCRALGPPALAPQLLTTLLEATCLKNILQLLMHRRYFVRHTVYIIFAKEEIRKDARIFFYNYDSYWKRDAVYTRLTSVGNSLLEHIDGQIHQFKDEQSRHLIFIGHSYGGLVIKEALIQAKRRHNVNHIMEQTKAIFFLGTPHRGSSFGPWGWLAASALKPLGSNPLILANLEYDSVFLSDLHESFIASIHDDLQVVNFFEQRPLRLLRLWFIQWQIFCVPERSATFDGRTVSKIGLPVDHYGLNKFGSRNECYNSIKSKLIKIVTPLVQPARRHYAVPVETRRHENASIPYAVTLHGLGGAGKSQLALKYAESHADEYNPVLWIDATSEETVRSSFIRCVMKLGLPDERGDNDNLSLIDDRVIQGVLQWLRDRNERDDEWLAIVDNADDVTWGVKKIMPRGTQGRLIITSRDSQSHKLVDRGCEAVQIGVMSPEEARMVLLRHLPDDINLSLNAV